jgi:hypothetical protein
LLSVYQKAVSNFNSQSWDQGAFAVFNSSFRKAQKMVEGVPEVRDTFGVAACLQKAKDNGFDNQGCFQDYFLKGQQANEYFEYSNITETNPDSSQIHACMTFSGGAEHPDPAVASQFKACLEGFDNATKCDIPSIMWSGRSTNRVPVASYHTMVIDNMEKRKEFAESNIANIRGNVLTVLEQIANDFDGRALSVSVFSSDGDMLHQLSDCVMMVSSNTFISYHRTRPHTLRRRRPHRRRYGIGIQ